MRDNKRQNDGVLDHQLIEEFLRITSQLLKNSKPLDPEFAKVLNENYWDLLVTDDETK